MNQRGRLRPPHATHTHDVVRIVSYPGRTAELIVPTLVYKPIALSFTRIIADHMDGPSNLTIPNTELGAPPVAAPPHRAQSWR